MAGTVTTTEETYGTVKKVLFDWLSSAGGLADATTTESYSGVLERAVFVPDAGGTAPDNLYDVVVNDEDGYDVLVGLGADLSNSATVSKSHADGLGAVANDTLTLGVSGANAAKGGVVILYLR